MVGRGIVERLDWYERNLAEGDDDLVGFHFVYMAGRLVTVEDMTALVVIPKELME